MKKFYALLLLTFGVIFSSQAQTKYFSLAGATDFNDVTTWGTNPDGSGTNPSAISATDTFVVANAATLQLSGNASIARLFINSGTLRISANTLTVAFATGNNSAISFLSGATLNLSGGAINLKGQFAMVSGAKFLQSGGTLSVDGNNGGVASGSVTGNIVILYAAVPADLQLTGGTILIVDPSHTTAYAFWANCTSAVNAAVGHTIQYGDGISTDAGGTNGFYSYLFPGSSYLIQGNVIANGGTGTNRFVNTQSNHGILGNLTVNANSEYRLASITYLSGNLVNNGTLSTTSTLNFASYANATVAPATNAQTVSGTGIFRNSTTTPTANFASVTVNNTSTAGVSIPGFSNIASQPANSVSVSGTLLLTAGKLSGPNNLFVLGTSVPAAGTLTYTTGTQTGGFTSGTTFGRWFTAAGTGTAITGGSDPTNGTSRYPFITAAGAARSVWVSRVSPTAAGIIGVTYQESTGTTPVSPVVTDGAYNINTRSNDSWTISLVSGTAAATSYQLAIVAPGAYAAPDNTTRIMKATTVVGTHQNGTSTPGGQRIGIPSSDLLGTYYLGFNLPSCFIPTSLSNTVTSTSTANHSWMAPTSGTPASGYEYAVTTSATPPASGTPTTALTAASTGLTPNTTYYLHVRTFCGGTDFSSWATSSFLTGYCQPSGTSTATYFNALSTTGGSTNINTTNTLYGTPNGYQDFTAQTLSVNQGQSINLTGTLVGTTTGVSMYVDLNDNFVFEAAERIYTSNAFLTTLNVNITIPSTAQTGTHRLRFVTDFNSITPTACGFSSGRGEIEDYTISITAQPPCADPINGGTATSSVSTVCGSGTTTLNASGFSSGTGLSFQWQSSPAGANTFTDISGATTVPYTTGTISTSTDFRLVVTCVNGPASGTSNIVTLNIGSVPANDLVCNAIALVLDGAADCGNTTCATSAGDPSFTSSTANNTTWYTYTPTVAGPIVITMARPTGVTTGLLNAWVGIYTATGTCPSLTFTQLPATTGYDLVLNPTVSVTTGSLNAGTTYYFMVDGNSGAVGAYCISIQAPPTPPNCTTNISPADGATNVSTIPNVTFTWNPAQNATSYDLYVGTTNPPTGLVANYTGTTATVVGFSASTTYFWYVVPKNAGGPAVGCTTNVTSFVTSAQCNPTTTNGGTVGDGFTDFVLNGEGTSAISVIGAPPVATPGYTDLSGTTNVDLAAGKAYAGNFKTQSNLDYMSIWIDFNDNGGFEASERVLSNLNPNGSSVSTPFSIMIPSGAATGVHKMRAREIYYSAVPTLPTDPCGGYTYGEAKDFTVTILAAGAGSPMVVSNSTTANSCVAIAKTTIDAASNNNNTLVYVLDSLGNVVAGINGNGNSLGRVTSSIYRNTSAVREDVGGNKYMDRNITINVVTQPTTAVDVRLYFTAAELAAIQAADPTITGPSGLDINKNQQACAATYSGNGAILLSSTGNGTQGSDYYVQGQTTGFSTFFITKAAVVLPIKLEYFTGLKTTGGNNLDWKVTCISSPSVTMVLERSAESRNFTTIYNLSANSVRCATPFNYLDANVVGGVSYYRLKMIDIDGNVTYSNVVALFNKESGIEITGLYPNPVQDMTTLSIATAKSTTVEIKVTDVAGKVIYTKKTALAAGNNQLGLNLQHIAAGSYQVTVYADNTTIKTVRFIKQ